MREVGLSMDRRCLQHLGHYCQDKRVHSLICMICAQIFTDCTGSRESTAENTEAKEDAWKCRWYLPVEKQVSEIYYLSVQQTLLQWYRCHEESFKKHLSLQTYRQRFFREEEKDDQWPELQMEGNNWEWRRRLKISK